MDALRYLSLFFFFLLLSGCAASGPTGKWSTSRDAQAIFESATLLENHTYYYIGSSFRPDALIAIDNAFTLDTAIWSRVDLTQQMLDDWMYWFGTERRWNCPYQGGKIITPDGRTAGVWYSKKTYNTVKLLGPQTIQVYSPFSMRGTSCYREEVRDDR